MDGILDQVEGLLKRWVAFPSIDARVAVTLWIAHCHVFEAFECTPRLALISAEKGSGKTRTLEVIELLAPDAYNAVSLSPAALYRIVDEARPTFLLDEADTYFGPKVAEQHEDLRGLVNAGHRRGAKAWRCVTVGKTITAKAFNAFCPVALASIGDIPDTILDRAVVVRMRRRGSSERLQSFRMRHARAVGARVRDQLVSWSDVAAFELHDVDPVMPAGLVDRAADVWEPLLAIADAAGQTWADRARKAATAMNDERLTIEPSEGLQLLRDTRAVFLADVQVTPDELDRLTTEELGALLDDRTRALLADRKPLLPTEELLALLLALVESPWGGLKLNAYALADRLRPYRIQPVTRRFGERSRRSYAAADFVDAWDRYLPPWRPPPPPAEQLF